MHRYEPISKPMISFEHTYLNKLYTRDESDRKLNLFSMPRPDWQIPFLVLQDCLIRTSMKEQEVAHSFKAQVMLPCPHVDQANGL